jgi:hypothetical protein
MMGLLIFLSGIEMAVSQGSYLEDESLRVQLLTNERDSDENLISIQFTNVNLSEAFEILANKINVGFSYNPDVIPDKKVTFNMSDAPVYRVIYKLLEGTELEPVLPTTKDVIVIRKKEPILAPELM